MTEEQATGSGPDGYGPGGGGPPGGHGGPPPGGVGGPSPGGAGFGAPPPGGYGGPPPGGYGGPPPGGYGGPPMPPMAPLPPPKNGPNVGLIIGLGCLGVFVLAGIASAILLFLVRGAVTTSPRPTAVTTPPPRAGGASGGGGVTGTVKAELRDLRAFKGELGKGSYFVGEIYNTGELPVGYPTATITVFDATNTALETATCSSVVRALPPGEKVPCTAALLNIDAFATSKVDVKPTRSASTRPFADLKVEGIKFTAKAGYQPHRLEGKITNASSFKAISVWALVSLYGSDGKIVGAQQALVAGSDLEAGQSAMFNAKIFNAAATPTTYQVKAVGYGE